MVEFWRKEYISDIDRCMMQRKGTATLAALTLGNFQGMYIVLGTGCALAIVTIIVELILRKSVRPLVSLPETTAVEEIAMTSTSEGVVVAVKVKELASPKLPDKVPAPESPENLNSELPGTVVPSTVSEAPVIEMLNAQGNCVIP